MSCSANVVYADSGNTWAAVTAALAVDPAIIPTAAASIICSGGGSELVLPRTPFLLPGIKSVAPAPATMLTNRRELINFLSTSLGGAAPPRGALPP